MADIPLKGMETHLVEIIDRNTPNGIWWIVERGVARELTSARQLRDHIDPEKHYTVRPHPSPRGVVFTVTEEVSHQKFRTQIFVASEDGFQEIEGLPGEGSCNVGSVEIAGDDVWLELLFPRRLLPGEKSVFRLPATGTELVSTPIRLLSLVEVYKDVGTVFLSPVRFGNEPESEFYLHNAGEYLKYTKDGLSESGDPIQVTFHGGSEDGLFVLRHVDTEQYVLLDAVTNNVAQLTFAVPVDERPRFSPRRVGDTVFLKYGVDGGLKVLDNTVTSVAAVHHDLGKADLVFSVGKDHYLRNKDFLRRYEFARAVGD